MEDGRWKKSVAVRRSLVADEHQLVERGTDFSEVLAMVRAEKMEHGKNGIKIPHHPP